MKKTLFFIQLIICLIVTVISVLIFNGSFNEHEAYYKMLQYFSILCFTIFLFTNPYPLISCYSFIIIFSYIYNCGQVWLMAFNVDFTYTSYLIDRYSYSDISYALLFFLIIISIIHLFGILFYKPDITKDDIDSKKSVLKLKENVALKYTGIIILVLCIIFLSYNDIKQIINAQILGYAESYTIGRDDKLLYALYHLFPLSIFILMLTIKENKTRQIVFWFAILRSVFLMLLIGNRGQYMSLICVLIVLKKAIDGKLNNKNNYLNYLSWLIILIIISSFVAASRNVTSNVLSINTFTDFIFTNNILVQFFQELGGTLVNTILVVINCPYSLDFGLGISYLGSLVSFIPFGSIIFENVVEYNDLGDVLNNYFHKGSGLGGSYIAELYFNFGWFSFIIAPLFGFTFSKISQKLNSCTIYEEKSALSTAIYAYTFYAILMFVRGNFYDIMVYARYLVYVLLLYFILRIILKK